FHAKALHLMAETMTAVAARAVEEWKAAGKEGAPIDVGERMSLLTSPIAGATLLGVELDGHTATTVVRAAKTALTIITHPNNTVVRVRHASPTAENTRVLAARDEIDKVGYAVIGSRRAGQAPERPDMLQLLLEARDPETGDGLNDQELRDETLTLFGAGTDTS